MARVVAVFDDLLLGSNVLGMLRAWAAWDRRFGILEREIDTTEAFDTSLVGPVNNP